MQEKQNHTTNKLEKILKAWAAHIYGGRYYGAADQCMADLLQRGKPMGAGLSDKKAGRKSFEDIVNSL